MQGPELESIIRQNIEGVQTLIVSDVSGGCGQAFDVVIVSPIFEGLPTLKRHRFVNEKLKDQIAQLHAFSQKTYTPSQYEALAGKAGPSVDSKTSIPASSTHPTSPTPDTLATPFTPPQRNRGSSAASHNRTASNVSIPELTLTTDDETVSGRAASRAAKPLSPGAQPGGTTQQLPEMHASPSSTPSSSVSRLHLARVSSVDFWEGLRAYLESQLISPASPSAGLASPTASGSGNQTLKGEAELHRLWEDFFQSQKPHLSASDVAKVRDGVGMFGWV